MPTTQEITEGLIRENITRAVADVAKTMLGHAATLTSAATQSDGHGWPPMPGRNGDTPTPQVVGMVGFLGELNGLIYLYFPFPFARLATGQLLGMTEAELDAADDDVVNDAIGELTNMSVGGFKNGLCDAGYPCKLTIPSILRGSNFCIEPITDAQRFIYTFSCIDHKIVTDILLKGSD